MTAMDSEAYRLKRVADNRLWKLANPEKVAAGHAREAEKRRAAAAAKKLNDPREIARHSGETHYFPVKPCVRGHLVLRTVARNFCLECLKESNRKYVSNPKHQVKLREKRKAYRAANIDRIQAALRDWRVKNHEAGRVYRRNRRALVAKSVGHHTASDVQVIYKAQRGKCAYCRTALSKSFHVDHIIPLALGGSNDRRNIQVACRECNQRKNAKHPIVFAQEIGRLL